MAGLTVNADIKKRVIQYNRENSQYRAVVKEYESSKKLNFDIVSGHMPDILMAEGFSNGESIPVGSYIKKGLIADVGALIEKDDELSAQEFIENVFDANFGDGWSMEKMAKVLDGMDQNAQKVLCHHPISPNLYSHKR